MSNGDLAREEAMKGKQEQDFTLYIQVAVNGYGSAVHEEKLAANVEQILKTKMGDKIRVKRMAVARDEDERRVS